MAGAVDPQSSLSLEAWSNLGRIAGLEAADRVGFLNSLMAAGMFGRVFKKLGKSVTGVKIKDIVVEAALYPRKAVQLADRTSNIMEGFWLTFAKGFIDTVNVPGTIARRPAATVPILKRGEEELDEDPRSRVRPQASLQPTEARPRRMAVNGPPPRAPVAGSSLSKASPVGPLPMGQGPMSPEMLARGQQIFGANDPIFAGHGGYINGGTGSEDSGSEDSGSEDSGIMSIQCKPRQIVG